MKRVRNVLFRIRSTKLIFYFIYVFENNVLNEIQKRKIKIKETYVVSEKSTNSSEVENG